MLRIYTRENERLVPVDLTVTAENEPAPPAGQILWIDLLHPTAEEDRFVDKIVGVSIPTREEMAEIEMSSRLYNEDGGEFMTIAGLAQLDTDAPLLTPITFVLKGQTLVTVRFAEPRPFQTFSMRAQRAGTVNVATGEHIMLGLLEALIDRIADTLERVGSKIDVISREIFHKSDVDGARTNDFKSVLVQIGREGDTLSLVRESLVSIARVLTYHTAVTEDSNKKAIKETRQRIRSVQRDVSSLADHSTYLSGKVSFLLDSTLGLINIEQNHLIKIFSIVAVCLMPPTVIASIYGMNFRHMPELEWTLGYPLALLLMVITAIIPFAYFRRKGWL